MNYRNICHHFLPYLFSGLGFLGIYLGGIYSGVGILVIFILHPLLDIILTKLFGEIESLPTPPSNASIYFYPFYQTILLFTGLYFISQQTEISHQILGAVSLGIITGGFGITVSHELIHRPKKWEIGLGVFLLSQVSYAVFRIEHVLGHHRNVATPEDPASAKLNDNVYMFVPKAIVKTHLSALAIENKRIKKKSLSVLNHRLLHYLGFQALWPIIFYTLFGLSGALLFIGQSLVAIILLELVDYIEHYGLQRKLLPNGSYEPVGPQHSWDTNFFITNTSLFNLGKHAHHHQKAGVPYQKLTSTKQANQYQFGYSTAIIISLIPPLWFKIINPKITI